MKLKIILSLLCGLVLLVLCGRYIYYGSLTRDCIYTEEIRPLHPTHLNSEVLFFKSATLLKGAPLEYKCLPEMGRMNYSIVPNRYSQYEKRIARQTDPLSGLRLTPAKIISVTKHGISTIDSGSGPIKHLILKDDENNFYEIPLVYLGINSGDEFLKMVNEKGETILDSNSVFE